MQKPLELDNSFNPYQPYNNIGFVKSRILQNTSGMPRKIRYSRNKLLDGDTNVVKKPFRVRGLDDKVQDLSTMSIHSIDNIHNGSPPRTKGSRSISKKDNFATA